ncbi:MAG: V-type ATP synthase subunit D [Methanoculleaceae archaeon]
MMEQVKPTRMELIRKREQIRLAEQGRDLLKEKMDALIREFFSIMHHVSRSRKHLEEIADASYLSLLAAMGMEDPITLKSASFATRRMITLDIKGKNIMGVPVPIIEKRLVTRSMMERGYSIIGTSWRIDETAEQFESQLDIIIQLAETETALRRLGGEIQMTRRRVNALDQVVIPELKQQTRYIKLTIEEREREDLFRLKKVKKTILKKRRKRKERRAAQAASTISESA